MLTALLSGVIGILGAVVGAVVADLLARQRDRATREREARERERAQWREACSRLLKGIIRARQPLADLRRMYERYPLVWPWEFGEVKRRIERAVERANDEIIEWSAAYILSGEAAQSVQDAALAVLMGMYPYATVTPLGALTGRPSRAELDRWDQQLDEGMRALEQAMRAYLATYETPSPFSPRHETTAHVGLSWPSWRLFPRDHKVAAHQRRVTDS